MRSEPSIRAEAPIKEEPMRGGRTWLGAGIAAALVAAFSAGGIAGAEDDVGGGMPVSKKVDPAVAKAMVGTWNVSGDMTGTSTMRLALGDTAIVEELQTDMGGTPYHGLGVFKFGDGGKMTVWWFDASPEPHVYRGTTGPQGCDLTSGDVRLTTRPTATGAVELKMYDGDQQIMALTYTRKK
jgi:hypothetical protein